MVVLSLKILVGWLLGCLFNVQLVGWSPNLGWLFSWFRWSGGCFFSPNLGWMVGALLNLRPMQSLPLSADISNAFHHFSLHALFQHFDILHGCVLGNSLSIILTSFHVLEWMQFVFLSHYAYHVLSFLFVDNQSISWAVNQVWPQTIWLNSSPIRLFRRGLSQRTGPDRAKRK